MNQVNLITFDYVLPDMEYETETPAQYFRLFLL